MEPITWVAEWLFWVLHLSNKYLDDMFCEPCKRRLWVNSVASTKFPGNCPQFFKLFTHTQGPPPRCDHTNIFTALQVSVVSAPVQLFSRTLAVGGTIHFDYSLCTASTLHFYILSFPKGTLQEFYIWVFLRLQQLNSWRYCTYLLLEIYFGSI